MSRSLKVGVTVSLAMVALLYGLIEHGRSMRATLPLRQLPSTARAVLRIDTSALLDTPAAEVLVGAFVGEKQLTEIEKTCGIAPLEALSDIVVWVRGPDDQPFQSIGLMLRGRSANASKLAECHRLLVSARGGSVVRLDAPVGPLLASRDRRSAIALVDDRTVVTGSVRTVAETMEVEQGIVPPLLDRAPIASLWRRLAPQAAVTGVLEPPPHWREALQNLGRIGDQESALEGVRALGFAIPSGSQRRVEAQVDFIDAETARRDQSAIETWLHHPPDSVATPWADVMRSARVQAEGATVRISLDVSALGQVR
jgi:hypothetical protein